MSRRPRWQQCVDRVTASASSVGSLDEDVEGWARDASPDSANVRPPRISSAGDVLALAVMSLGGLLGLVLSPVLATGHLIKRRRQQNSEAQLLYEERERHRLSADPDAAVREDDDSHWAAVTPRAPAGSMKFPAGTTRRSGYVRMSDGVDIAVDVLLPPSFGDSATRGPVPCVLHKARYWRAYELRWPARAFVNGGQPWDFMLGSLKCELLLAGFAVVSADVRGAGASGGTQSVVWSSRETEDSREILDFIAGSTGEASEAGPSCRRHRVRQPWSDGRVALFGISYDAGAAVRAAASGHPAVRAVVSSFVFGDVWRELFNGGIMNRWFLKAWCHVNETLDHAQVRKLHPLLPLFLKGAAPAGPRRQQDRFVAEHAGNWDLMSAVSQISFIDDSVELASGETTSCERFSLFPPWKPSLSSQPDSAEDSVLAESEQEQAAAFPALAASGVAVMLISGWMCVTSITACSAFAAFAQPGWRLLLGPWNHGGIQHARYASQARLKKFATYTEITDFLLKNLPPVEPDQQADVTASQLADPEVHYYRSGSSPGWCNSPVWPPKDVEKRPLWLAPAQRLDWAPPEGESSTSSQLPRSTGAAPLLWGGVSRYTAMIKMTQQIEYKWLPSCAIQRRDALLFETSPLEAPLSVVGSAVLSLRVRGAGASDADVFAYLCERSSDGALVYITEGMLRLSNRAEEVVPAHTAAADPPLASGVEARLWGEAAVPHHSFRRADAAPLKPGEVSQARLQLFPTAYKLRAGSRLALVLAPDDAAHFAPNPAATQGATSDSGNEPPQICHSELEPSVLWLPVLDES
ncbi:unnamed protein product [Polarella glacialis]|uniref:Xaa-Pro dipeptidyl-peptidase C-terminal domain-containing protein n=1 Tax=Polarella glacialis TaxID=89957 RepID=A0A813LHN1_POLGL|nr:unnamed protein product [Polarella glacialis]CAE8726522.1 unnamed protein product [Polarella glacialis]